MSSARRCCCNTLPTYDEVPCIANPGRMLLDLPSECVLGILKRVDIADVVAIGCCARGLRSLVRDETFWCELSEAKWGMAVTALKSLADKQQQSAKMTASSYESPTTPRTVEKQNIAHTEVTSWFCYASKRMCLRSNRPSPFRLIQEAYTDPWQHITCCVLCSRTSGSDTIRSAIAHFFTLFPTPTDVLEADDDTIKEVIHPLGLQPTRLAAVRAVARDFLATDWQEPAQFKGCGKFVTDSWRIFCKGSRETKGVNDARLKQYLAWVSRQQEATAAEPSKPTAQQATSAHAQDNKCRDKRGKVTAYTIRITRSQTKAAVTS